jgi:hypothetical protein
MAQIGYNGFPTLNTKVAQLSVFYCSTAESGTSSANLWIQTARDSL